MNDCAHPSVHCVNPYEIIRKYRCDSCGGVMMCACDEELGRRFFSHQLDSGTELETQQRVPVTLGFQPRICNACRGLPEEAHPKGEIHGSTTKIRRYYWREILLETTKRFGDWQLSPEGQSASPQERTAKRKAVERETIEEIKTLHQRSPKYDMREESQEDIITKYQVEIINLQGIHTKTAGKKIQILDGTEAFSAEDFAARHFHRLGYQTLFTESVPFHVLFGVFMWLLIQDPGDPDLQIRGFDDREAFEAGRDREKIWTLMSLDFGSTGYAKRRERAIDKHLDWLPKEKDDLLWAFDYWVGHSWQLRQYLWAHRPQDVARAREIAEILPVEIIVRILRYLIGGYWHRYCGWPDLLIHNENEFCFIEVKSSKDELRLDQKNWIRGNHQELHLPFKLVKIHNKNPQGQSQGTP